MLSWMINRRVLVQRCPAVPTAPNTAPIMVIFRSALGLTIMALLPPNSNKDLPRRFATTAATSLPMRVDPVAETNGIRSSSEIHFPTSASPTIIEEIPSGNLFAFNMSAMISWQATAHNGVFSLGFQTTTSPHTKANAAFHDQTATGKLNAVIMPTIASGWYWSYIR